MSETTPLNQTIECINPDGNELSHVLTVEFIKRCVLALLAQFIKTVDLPPELIGYVLHIEAEIKKADLLPLADYELARWLERQSKNLQQRERLYAYWNARTPQNQKLSYKILQLKSQLFSEGEQPLVNDQQKELQQIINKAKMDLRFKLEQEKMAAQKAIIINEVNKAMNAYLKSTYWLLNSERREQQQELLLLITQAADPHQAIHILRCGILQIEQQHILKSLPANLAFYQRSSRLATHLTTALHEIHRQINASTAPQRTLVESIVEKAIDQYLADDMFYHNRHRRYLAYELRIQLREDALMFSSEKNLQRQHKMRTTLDEFIKKIDDQYIHTHFFSKYAKKRSRLAQKLEEVKQQLIQNGHLPQFELATEVKQPIVNEIKLLLRTITPDVDMTQDINSLCCAIHQAETPHAIEAMLEGHIRSSYQQAGNTDFMTTLKNLFTQTNPYFAFAIKLEDALLTWQARGLLPNTSHYKTFLESLAEQRQQNENVIIQLETQYKIKIPHDFKNLKTQVSGTRQQAETLRKRINNI